MAVLAIDEHVLVQGCADTASAKDIGRAQTAGAFFDEVFDFGASLSHAVASDDPETTAATDKGSVRDEVVATAIKLYRARATTAAIAQLGSLPRKWDPEGAAALNLAVATGRAGESKAWSDAIDSLVSLSQKAALNAPSTPGKNAFGAAIRVLQNLRMRLPNSPPTFITLEPAGGIIVERRVEDSSGDDTICELTFYNDGEDELTSYVNGKVVEMTPLSSHLREFGTVA